MNRIQVHVLIQLLHAKGIGARSLDRILTVIAAKQSNLDEFSRSSDSELSTRFSLRGDVIASYRLSRDVASRIVDRLEQQDVSVIVKGESRYPARLYQILGRLAPPILFVKGNINILEDKSVGFCGSRRSTLESIEATREIAHLLATRTVNVISGYAVGVDMAAHTSALMAKGVTTLVLAEGILDFVPRGSLREWISPTNTLIVSQFLPTGKWMVGNAMQRNETICALSNSMVLIESRSSGGTFAAGNAALRLGRPLFLLSSRAELEDSIAYNHFLNLGAKPINRSHRGYGIEALMDATKHDFEGRRANTELGPLFSLDI